MGTIPEKIRLQAKTFRELGKYAPENSKVNSNGKQFDDLMKKKMLKIMRVFENFLKQQALLAFVVWKKMILTETILFCSQSQQLRTAC